jgi:hypothetical protein
MTYSFSRRPLLHGFSCNYKFVIPAILTIQTKAFEGKQKLPVLPRTSCLKSTYSVSRQVILTYRKMKIIKPLKMNILIL